MLHPESILGHLVRPTVWHLGVVRKIGVPTLVVCFQKTIRTLERKEQRTTYIVCWARTRRGPDQISGPPWLSSFWQPPKEKLNRYSTCPNLSACPCPASFFYFYYLLFLKIKWEKNKIKTERLTVEVWQTFFIYKGNGSNWKKTARPLTVVCRTLSGHNNLIVEDAGSSDVAMFGRSKSKHHVRTFSRGRKSSRDVSIEFGTIAISRALRVVCELRMICYFLCERQMFWTQIL